MSAAAFRGRWERYAPVALLGLALFAAAVVLLSYSSGLTYFQDTWEFLMNRRAFTADALLQPHNEHIVLIPVLIEQLILRVFGMSSTTPETVVLVAMLLVSAALVFVYVRRRLGPWLAVMSAVLLLFLGPAWQDLLWPFQIGFVGSIAAGVAMLLALEREDERGDLTACILLVISIAFSSLGLAFAAAAAVDVVQRRRSRGLRRAYVAAVPLLLYGVWYLGWGHDAETHLTLHNVLVSPRYVIEGLSSSLDSIFALGTIAHEAVGRSRYGLPLLIALILLLIFWKVRRPGISDRLWPVLAAAAVYWFLSAFNYIPGREAYSSRYLYPGAVFVVLIAADQLKGVHLGRGPLLAAAAIVVAAAAFNLTPLREGRDFFRGQTVLTRSDLGAIEIARRTVKPSFALPPEVSGTSFLNEIHAGEYLQAVREFGSPAFSPQELQTAKPAGRKQADVVLANALPVTTEVKEGGGPATGGRGRCLTVAGGGPNLVPISLRPGVTSIAFAPGGAGTIRLRRFATDEYPLITEGIAAGTTTLLKIPPDRATLPWRLQVESPQQATVCR